MSKVKKPTDQQREQLRLKPKQPHVMHQTWRDLLFLHWRVDPEAIQSTLPDGLYVDTYQDSAFLGVVPFYMAHVRPRFLPPLPGLSYFPEMNLRTYVYDANGVPGVWFYSLDAAQATAVRIARTFFHLPYFNSQMRMVETVDTTKEQSKSWITYDARRLDHQEFEISEVCQFRYRGNGDVFQAASGSIEYFLAERYLLFARQPKSGRFRKGRVWHKPYPLQKGLLLETDAKPSQLIYNNASLKDSVKDDGKAITPSMPSAACLNNPMSPDLVHFSKGVNVTIYPLQSQ